MGEIRLYPITGALVRDALNKRGASVANRPRAYFTSAAHICDASKRKPVRQKATACQDYDASAPGYLPGWWKAFDGFCGYNVDKARAESWTELRDRYNGADNGWVYELPTGGDFPLRLGDFGGYNPDARPLSYGFLAPEVVYKSQPSVTIAINLPAQNEDSLTWYDFDWLQNRYFGVLIYSSAGSLRVTAEGTIAEGDSLITFRPSRLAAGRTYTVYPFISSVRYVEGENEDEKVTEYYTLPHVEPSFISVKDSAIRVTPTARKVNATETIEWEIMVYNETTSAVTFEDNTIRIYKDKRTAAMIGDYNARIPAVTVPARTSAIIASGVGSVGYRDSRYDFATTPLYIEVSLGGGQHFSSGMVAEDLSGGDGAGEV